MFDFSDSEVEEGKEDSIFEDVDGINEYVEVDFELVSVGEDPFFHVQSELFNDLSIADKHVDDRYRDPAHENRQGEQYQQCLSDLELLEVDGTEEDDERVETGGQDEYRVHADCDSFISEDSVVEEECEQ